MPPDSNIDITAILPIWQPLIIAEKLPPQWLDDALHYFVPLALSIAARRYQQPHPLVVGINGAQGTGKSTLAKALALMLEHKLNLTTVALSLDDFYLSHQARKQLGATVHPLLATRGVPGTHDVGLALATLKALSEDAGPVHLPRFDKATDDSAPRAMWPTVQPPCDIIIVEGWCIGAQPQDESALSEPVNELEALEDSDGRWRRHVNSCLAAGYQDLFKRMDMLVMLKAPSFTSVYEWRCLQEEKLAERHSVSPGNETHLQDTQIMTPDAILRFIHHYERLTRHCIDTLPGRADVVFHLDANHRISHTERNQRH